MSFDFYIAKPNGCKYKRNHSVSQIFQIEIKSVGIASLAMNHTISTGSPIGLLKSPF